MTGPVPGADGSQSGENTCPQCAGDGRVEGGDCPTCEGTGIVAEPVGDA